MGNAESTPEPVVGEKVVEQLSSLQLQETVRQQGLEHGYVHVEADVLSSSGGSPTVSTATAARWEKQLLADPKNRLALSALLSNPVQSIISQKVATLSDTQTFNVKIPLEGAPITNQRSSGRCWLFATTNVFRVAIMKKHNLKEFELSQAYLFFWDKLEKANFFLEQMIDTADLDLEDRLIQALLGAPVNDGGQWDMAVNLVSKYGLVPQVLYPDSYTAMNSAAMDRILTTKLREDALQLRAMATGTVPLSRSSLLAVKEKMLQEIYGVLTLTLGPPPKPDDTFTWEYYDADGKFQKVSKTPLALAKELSSPSAVSVVHANVNELFSLVNDPRHKYGQLMTVDRLGNVVGGRPVTYVNVDMDTMKQAAIAMLHAGLPIFFGSDVGKYSDSKSGIMDPALYDYHIAFNITLGMDKAQRLMVQESAATHAMVLTAVQVEDGKPVRWRVQNSWGDAAGDKGWFVMSDTWMDEFVYQVVVDPSFVSEEIREILNSKPLVLPLWDPMGALA